MLRGNHSEASRLTAAQDPDLDGLTRAQAEHSRRQRFGIHDLCLPDRDDDIADDQAGSVGG